MPAVCGIRPVVIFQIVRLGFGCHRRCFIRVETEGDNFEFLAGVELENAKALNKAIEAHRTKRRTRVIDRRENHRLAMEEVSKMNRFPRFIVEWKIEIQRSAKLLIDADLLED